MKKATMPAKADDRTYMVTELCPHCENEVEMRWDTDSRGYKAFCPVCGKRLMLCDECQHSENYIPCDYNGLTDSCSRCYFPSEIKLGTVTPIDAHIRKSDGQKFTVWWNRVTGKLIAKFENGEQEDMQWVANTLIAAIHTTQKLYCDSSCWICEMKENPQEGD